MATRGRLAPETGSTGTLVRKPIPTQRSYLPRQGLTFLFQRAVATQLSKDPSHFQCSALCFDSWLWAAKRRKLPRHASEKLRSGPALIAVLRRCKAPLRRFGRMAAGSSVVVHPRTWGSRKPSRSSARWLGPRPADLTKCSSIFKLLNCCG